MRNRRFHRSRKILLFGKSFRFRGAPREEAKTGAAHAFLKSEAFPLLSSALPSAVKIIGNKKSSPTCEIAWNSDPLTGVFASKFDPCD
jgi:hypothetical protein